MSGRRKAGPERLYYCPPAMRRQNQMQKLKSKSAIAESNAVASGSANVGSSSSATNLDSFIEHTTPFVPAQHFPKTSTKGWRNNDGEYPPYFILGDLWESFKEWSVYGAGVPLILNGSDSVVQYYVPYLSGIQLYIDPSRPFTNQRRLGEESDAESSRGTNSDDNSEYENQCNLTNATVQGPNGLLMRTNPSVPASVSEGEIRNPPGLRIFEYFEVDPPYIREPLADKISVLASQFPELRTYKSCDLTPASWISVAWYPIYRIPVGPTLQNLEACFLTFHSLSTPYRCNGSDWHHYRRSTVSLGVHEADTSFKLSLSTFGLAPYKFNTAFWTRNGPCESQRVMSLLRFADDWLRSLQTNHPDYLFFQSHSSYWRSR